MYDWLADALQDSSQVVTASRRLARVLTVEYGRQQVNSGKTAWRTPDIKCWQDWLEGLLATAQARQELPIRINTHQSRVIWERCLRREINNPLLNLGALARQARETWLRLHEWNVSIRECEKSARGPDQRIFARAARNYQSILDREAWIDDSGLANLVGQLLTAENISVPSRVVLAGFDRIVPQTHRLLDALRASGCNVEIAATATGAVNTELHSYENCDAEMRAAGAWARTELEENPQLRIAIISSTLDQDAARRGRLVREGLVPGWQFSGARHASAVNVSYGRALTNYPAIEIAMLLLRWLHNDLSARDISLLLRTPMIGSGDIAGRIRLELMLRQLPDRNWSPQMLIGALQGRDETDDSLDWLQRIATLAAQKSEIPHRASPSAWAVIIDTTLKKLNWPGDQGLGSVEFQLVNRWRDLLNDLARLELVSPLMTFDEARARLTTMAAETVFQPEADAAVVHLLGPLEAAGMQFDRLWVCGLTAANWPPLSRPLALVSRELQRKTGMPDAEPSDTMEYAQRVLGRITRSAAQVVCSYPQTDADTEQTVTALLGKRREPTTPAPNDPGWYAAKLSDATTTVQISADPVPPVAPGELVAGGAATIQRQLSDPFAAFAVGRLGVRTLQPIASGLSASLRGSLIHDALHHLYAGLPAQGEIRSWRDNDLRARIKGALQSAFLRHERFADPVLGALMSMERQRVGRLLEDLVAADVGRDAFKIANVEWAVRITLGDVQLELRIDRIDQLDDGSLVILDYKTGMQKSFLDRYREPKDMQLVVYARAVAEPVAGLGLVNIDSRSISFDGAGHPFAEEKEWDSMLASWTVRVEAAAVGIQRGDVRVNVMQSADESRPLSLLSRIGELRRAG